MKPQAIVRPAVTAGFRPPFDRLSPTERLRHFRTRTDISFFPVPDQEQVQRNVIDAILDNRFTFNNETRQLPPGFDWHDNPSDDLEWQIMLHKFYFATGLGMAYQETGDEVYLLKWIELTESWIETVQPDLLANRSIFNDPLYVAVEGRRIQNWISAYYHFVATNEHAAPPADFHEALLASINAQVQFLTGHLAPSRNHRTLELWAVFMAAVVFPEFEAAARWQSLALEGLHDNILADLLPDGVQCELSTHYHHIVLRNYLSFRHLAELNGVPVASKVDGTLREALNFAIHVHKPDGDIPALSDADVFSYLDLIRLGAELYSDPELTYIATRGAKGRPPAERLARFADSGYVTMRSGWGDHGEAFEDERYLVFDCGPIGAGNHGHLDLLNIEVAAYGRSLIVDPGRYTYKEPPEESGEINWRARFRETAAHNTVVVDGKNQARYVRAGKARRCKIKGPHPDYDLKLCRSHERLDVVQGIAVSDEYDAVHERTIMFVDGAYWLIIDRLTAASEHCYDLRFHLGADAFDRTVITEGGDGFRVTSPHIQMLHDGADSTEVEPDFVSRTYGEKRLAPVVSFKAFGRTTLFATLLVPHPVADAPPRVVMGRMPATDSPRRAPPNALAFDIQIDDQQRSFSDLLCIAHDEADQCLQTDGSIWRPPYAAFRRNDRGRMITLGQALEESVDA